MFVPFPKLNGLALPAGDLWIFDGKRALQWQYKDGVGEMVGGTIWDEHDDISEFLKLKERLLSLAEPVV